MKKQVMIVGGGTGGWMAATYLRKAFGEKVEVTVLESPNIKTVGVGEATFSTIKLFFDYLGLPESEWMPSCNATYKLAIKFENWTSQGGHFYHPFQRYEMVDGYNLGEWWLKLKRGEEAFDYACFTTPAICDAKRSPRYLDGRVYDEKVQGIFANDGAIADNKFLADHQVQYPYAYQFDAHLLARFLEGYGTARGIKQIHDEVMEVGLADDGSIDHLVTKDNGNLRADLYVDCTGFRGLLINQALKEPFISFSESLLCDRAVALQVPVDIQSQGINPYTTATAMSAGWVWNIPLYGRVGTGYVYSSAFISPDEAEAEFRRHLGPAAHGLPANHIKMRIGRSRNSWVKNCVAIGLSSGFVEPLESTGIFFIQHGIEELIHHFPHGTPDEESIRSYNHNIAEAIDGVRHFLTLHYRASDRRDSEFWKATQSTVLPDELAERLTLWKKRLPNAKSINPNYHGFESYSYSVMMLGLNHLPETSLPVLDFLDDRQALEAFRKMRRKSEYLVNTLPSQYEYLSHIRAQAGVEDFEGPYWAVRRQQDLSLASMAASA